LKSINYYFFKQNLLIFFTNPLVSITKPILPSTPCATQKQKNKKKKKKILKGRNATL
jgi:hypothetical protein